MNLSKHLLSVAAIVVSLAWPRLDAQSQNENIVSLDFTTINWDTEVIKGLKYQSAESIDQIDVYFRGFTTPKHYKGPGELIFFRERQIPGQEAPVRKPVASVNLSNQTGEVLLIFMKDQKREEEFYKITAINRDRSNFPRSSYQIFNLSNFEITGKIDDQVFKLNKHKNTVIKLPKQKTAAIEVKFARSNGTEWNLAYSSLWGHAANKRVNIFICNSDNPVSPVKIRKFEEYVRD